MVDILLILLIVIVSFAVAFLVYSIWSAKRNFNVRLTGLECNLAQEEPNLGELEGDEELGEDDLP